MNNKVQSDERTNYPVVLYFNKFNLDMLSHWFCGIGKVNVPPRGGDMQRHEVYYTLQTKTPMGLNDELPFNDIL